MTVFTWDECDVTDAKQDSALTSVIKGAGAMIAGVAVLAGVPALLAFALLG